MEREQQRESVENLLTEFKEESELLNGEIEVNDEYFLLGISGGEEAVDQAVKALNDNALSNHGYVAEPFTDPDMDSRTVRVVLESVNESEKEVRDSINENFAKFD